MNRVSPFSILLAGMLSTACFGLDSEAAWTNPQVPSFRGAPGTEFSGWDEFTSAFGGLNEPDEAMTNSDDTNLSQHAAGAILTSTCNIYNPAATSSFEINDTVSADLLQVVLQIRSLGSPLDVTSIVLTTAGGRSVTPTVAELTPDLEWLLEWDLASTSELITSYSISFAAIGPNYSLDGARLDTRVDRQALAADVNEISYINGGTQTLSIDAGPANGSNEYWLLGSLDIAPGLVIQGVSLPLNYDVYFQISMQFANTGFLPDSRRTLDDRGRGVAAFVAPAGLGPSFDGLALNHAYLVLDNGTGRAVFASNPTSVVLVP